MTGLSRHQFRTWKGRSASARSLLLTILGEFVLARNTPAWTGALVSGLEELGVEEKAARQALARTASDGLLASARAGRRVHWHLTPDGLRLLHEGADRIYGFGRYPETWNGNWLVVVVSVPESQRQVRHRLRTRLTWAGLGSPAPGTWVSTDTRKEREVAEVIQDLKVDAFSFLGAFGKIGEAQQVVQKAWSLETVHDRYEHFLDTFGQSKPISASDTFAAQVWLVQEWRRFPFLDPALPDVLLSDTWPGRAAADLFHRRHEEWRSDAEAHWKDLCAAAAART